MQNLIKKILRIVLKILNNRNHNNRQIIRIKENNNNNRKKTIFKSIEKLSAVQEFQKALKFDACTLKPVILENGVELKTKNSF